MTNDTAVSLVPMVGERLLLFACPGSDARAAADDDIPASARRIAVIVDADGDTAPQPALPLTIRVYRDGTFAVAGGEG